MRKKYNHQIYVQGQMHQEFWWRGLWCQVSMQKEKFMWSRTMVVVVLENLHWEAPKELETGQGKMAWSGLFQTEGKAYTDP